MEGAGEGVVAVLEGTKNADLKVTMLPKRLYHRRKCVLLDLGINPSTRLTQSSVETGTDRVFKDASSRICDVKYSSSYQFADCICNSHQTTSGPSKYRRHGGFTRHSGLFEDSLRKYPDGTASSEILQRIINYTNTEQSE
ncbi:hypothetical protein KGM_201722 [Danaus plexippus plexippus]|uniref:Uncharacterized protein n=1 Tax=Danaus plexippus plexippus TaxID=278856 RepID=A0A212EVN4_DANPL|nr:hypothetical protein KGM_201722 [Danaus plexippus plexippus]